MAETSQRDNERKPLPICKAILLCNEITRDPISHATSVIGIFDTFLCDAFPLTLQGFVFLLLKEAIGEVVLTVEIHDLNDDVIVAQQRRGHRIGAPAERTSGEQWIPINGVVLNHSGTYDVIVFADGKEVDRTQFKAKTHKERADEKRHKGQP